jgi:phosphopantothenate-cysteine ligase
MTESQKKQVDKFLEVHSHGLSPIICITSGGTIVSLSTDSIPYLDNFSSGERGSNSVEYFLSKGYVVIFLHRDSSKYPFQRSFRKHFGGTVDDKLLSKIYHCKNGENDDIQQLVFNTDGLSTIEKELILLESKIIRNISNYKYYLPVTFVTVNEYLDLLEYIAKAMAFFGPRACFYLAAAVSDFYLPNQEVRNFFIFCFFLILLSF